MAVENFFEGSNDRKEPPREENRGRFSFSKYDEEAMRERLRKAGHSGEEIDDLVQQEKMKIESANENLGQREAVRDLEWQERERVKNEGLIAKMIEDDPKLREAIEKRLKRMEEDQVN